jgi:predicted nucleic acid-binding protein
LFALANADDPYHTAAHHLLSRTDLDLVIPTLCVGEAAYLIARDIGVANEAAFISGCAALDIRAPLPVEYSRIGELMHRHRDWPLGAVDASVVALAERLGTEVIATFDYRHFRAIRPRHVESFTLLP